MNDLFISLTYFYILIFIGYIFGRIFKRYNQQLRKFFSFILLYILAPPIIVFAFVLPNVSLDPLIVIYIILFGVMLVLTTQSIAYVYLRKRGAQENKRIGSILMLVALPNSMLFPLPIVLSLFGTQYVVILAIFALTAIVIRNTWITYLCIYYGDNKDQSYKQNIKSMLTFPPTIAIFISIILIYLKVKLDYEIIIITNELLSDLTTIFGAMLIGILLVNLNFNNISEYKKDFIFVVLIRVFFSLLLFFILIQFFIFPVNIRTQALIILLLVFVDPPAVTNSTYAEHFELDKEFTAFCVSSITILAVIYIPLILILGFMLF